MNKRTTADEARDIYEKAEKLEETFGEHFTGNYYCCCFLLLYKFFFVFILK